MVSSLNGASAQQVAIVNPFQQRQDQQNRVQDDGTRSGQSKKSDNTFEVQVSGQRSSNGSNALARADGNQNSQPRNTARGGLVDITV